MISFDDRCNHSDSLALSTAMLEVKPCFTLQVRLPSTDWFSIALISTDHRVFSGRSEKYNIHITLVVSDNTLLSSTLNGDRLSDFTVRYPTISVASQKNKPLLTPKDIKGRRLRKGDKTAKPFYLMRSSGIKFTY